MFDHSHIYIGTPWISEAINHNNFYNVIKLPHSDAVELRI